MSSSRLIKEINSTYNIPLWVVPKKADISRTKSWRNVVDNRRLNENTVSDKFPIPNIGGIINKLGRAQYLPSIDLDKGFHQILLDENDRKKQQFCLFRIPFELKNAPSTFQKL